GRERTVDWLAQAIAPGGARAVCGPDRSHVAHAPRETLHDRHGATMPDLRDLLARFLAAHAEADVLEATVDSTFVDGDVQPLLLVTAFALRAGDDVTAARARAGARDDGLWYDALDAVCELPLEMPLHAAYPAWPDGLD